jgi:hypothetical protein
MMMITEHISTHWPQFKALLQRYGGTRFEEQLQFHLPQSHVPDSTLPFEMNGLVQADNAKARDFHRKPLSESGWKGLGTIRAQPETTQGAPVFPFVLCTL